MLTPVLLNCTGKSYFKILTRILLASQATQGKISGKCLFNDVQWIYISLCMRSVTQKVLKYIIEYLTKRHR